MPIEVGWGIGPECPWGTLGSDSMIQTPRGTLGSADIPSLRPLGSSLDSGVLSSSCLHFLIYKMDMMIMPTSQGSHGLALG